MHPKRQTKRRTEFAFYRKKLAIVGKDNFSACSVLCNTCVAQILSRCVRRLCKRGSLAARKRGDSQKQIFFFLKKKYSLLVCAPVMTSSQKRYSDLSFPIRRRAQRNQTICRLPLLASAWVVSDLVPRLFLSRSYLGAPGKS